MAVSHQPFDKNLLISGCLEREEKEKKCLDKVLRHDQLDEGCRAVLPSGVVYYAVTGGSNF